MVSLRRSRSSRPLPQALGRLLPPRSSTVPTAVLAALLATVFVSLPFVVREVTPVLVEIGDEQEQAAATLGASAAQTFWRVTLPAIRWGLAYGIVLSTARAIGEFGAVSVVSGKVAPATGASLSMIRASIACASANRPRALSPTTASSRIAG